MFTITSAARLRFFVVKRLDSLSPDLPYTGADSFTSFLGLKISKCSRSFCHFARSSSEFGLLSVVWVHMAGLSYGFVRRNLIRLLNTCELPTRKAITEATFECIFGCMCRMYCGVSNVLWCFECIVRTPRSISPLLGTELESLIGSLHASRVQGSSPRTLLCSSYNRPPRCFPFASHPIRLNVAFRQELTWWRELFHSWDCMFIFFRMPPISYPLDLFVGSYTAGFGVIWRNRWLTGMWPHSMHEVSITVLELFPIMVAAHVWGSWWGRQEMEFLSHNSAFVAILNSALIPSSRDPSSMHLLRRFSLLAYRYHFSIYGG